MTPAAQDLGGEAHQADGISSGPIPEQQGQSIDEDSEGVLILAILNDDV